jgi:hypothetical protein
LYLNVEDRFRDLDTQMIHEIEDTPMGSNPGKFYGVIA